jgi:RNA polymerase sigma factor (sigma-70 family)
VKPEKTHLPNEAKLLKEYYETGDLEVLGKLYEPYMGLVFGVCLKYLRDPSRSEDAVMQIFESLIKKLRIHRVENFKPWLYTLARNHCLMELRSSDKKHEVSFDDSFVESDVFQHLDDSETPREERLQEMERCLEQLNQEQQLCVRLFYLEEKCYKDIVDITGYSMKQVKSYIQNGKRNLKICMDKTL